MDRPITYVQRLIDGLVSVVCVFLIPAGLAVLLIAAAFSWDPQTSGAPSRELDFRVIEDLPAALGPRQAMQQLASGPIVSGRDTKLSEAPFWFSFAAPPLASGEAVEVELSSRHAREVTCWDESTLQSLGFATRAGSAGQIRLAKAGFAIWLGNLQSLARVVCRGTFSGPAHMSVTEWAESQLALSEQRFSFDAGMLEGALILLTAYMAILAIVKRDAVYLLYAAWIAVTIYFSAATAGVDYQWLPAEVSPTLQPWLRQLVTAGSYITNIALIDQIFKGESESALEKWMLNICRGIAVGLTVAALCVPYQNYLPYLWLASAFGTATLTLKFSLSLMKRMSMVKIFFAAAMGISLLSFLYNIVSLTLGIKGPLSELNVPMAAMLSVLLMMVAVRQHLSPADRHAAHLFEDTLSGYEVLPVPLFRLAQSGSIVAFNRAFREATGLPKSGVNELRWSDVLGPESWESVNAELQKKGNLEFTAFRMSANPDGDGKFWVSLSLAAGWIEGSLEPVAEEIKPIARLPQAQSV